MANVYKRCLECGVELEVASMAKYQDSWTKQYYYLCLSCHGQYS